MSKQMSSKPTQPLNPSETLESVLVYNLLRTHSALAPLLDSDLRSSHLTAAQFNTLLILQNTGGSGLTMGELGQQLVVSKSNVTGLVDRLERTGWATRHQEPDRRAIRVRITPEGEALLQHAAPAHMHALAELTSCLTVREKTELSLLLTKLRRALRARRKAAS